VHDSWNSDDRPRGRQRPTARSEVAKKQSGAFGLFIHCRFHGLLDRPESGGLGIRRRVKGRSAQMPGGTMNDRISAEEMWDDRYRTEDFVYGTEPNAFLRDHLGEIPLGDVLCVADGEGRNSVFLAREGRRVTAVDHSAVGVAKARQLARAQGVDVDFVVADLRGYDLGVEVWDAVVSIFAHMPAKVRIDLHARIVRALRPGGVFVLEAYRPDQIGRGTGGPTVAEMTMTAHELEHELASLRIELIREIDRDIREGRGHQGVGAVVELIGRKGEPERESLGLDEV
jgi:SAM-dependent methyltransferase